jgi:hypothetical protein
MRFESAVPLVVLNSECQTEAFRQVREGYLGFCPGRLVYRIALYSI